MARHDYDGRIALVRWKGGAVGEETIEDCSQGEPKRIMVRAGQVPPGIDDAICSLDIGESGIFQIPYSKAYGEHDQDGVRTYPRWYVPGADEIGVGEQGTWVHPESREYVPITCVGATEDTITIDFNHPLAGKDLEYWIELVDVLD